MKKLIIVATIATSLMGCATPFHDNTVDFDREMIVLNAEADSGRLTELQFAERAAGMARQYFPTDYRFHALRDYKVYLARRLEEGRLDRTEYEHLWAERRSQFLEDRQQIQQANAADDAERRRRAAAAFANSMSNAARNTYPAPAGPVRCTSMQGIGNSVSTTCY